MNIVISESLTAQKPSYDRFAKLQQEIASNTDSQVNLYIEVESRLGYTFLFLISTLPFLAEKYGKKLQIFCNHKSFQLFGKMGFINTNEAFDAKKNYSPLLRKSAGLICKDEDVFSIVTAITTEAPVEMSDRLEALFISKAGEMYNNAREHSQGVVLGAKYFRNQKSTYTFACYDTGIGIPQKVMGTKLEILDSLDAFKWAMVDGNSTAGHVMPRGLGMGLLKSFVFANEGAIRICSGDVLYTYSRKKGESYHRLPYGFYGTLFEMDIIADNERAYILR